ncbi:NAC domain-containing protein 13-like [Quercus lobata]|uniref:NAC domain-containing protein n=1 Tax=Quercus lobata TaxID=97700 RepID=A0A7N2KS75_QUELO|nr:NAC domain-containing protein 13-like [Quercus lobata]
MCPLPVPSGIESDVTAEKIIGCLCKIDKGDLRDHPSNLMSDIDFLRYDPENLPPGMWFLIHSEVDGVYDHGKWSIKGEAYKIVLDSMTTCLRTTFEHYKGQGPHERRTNWVMHEYRILKSRQFEGSNMKETNSLCGVFRYGEQSQNHEKQLKLGSTNTASENHIHTTQSVVPNADNSIGQSSTSQPQVSVADNRVILALRERSPDHQHQNLHEVEDHPEDDYLEILDLENPLSPSSSSESSCVTISSDDWFDSVALMQEMESENNQRNAGYVSAPVKPNMVVVLPATSGSLNREKMLTPSEIPKTDSSTPESAVHRQGSKIPKPNLRNEGSSSNSHNLTPPFSSHIVPADQENTAAVVRKKKFRKYLCFMPF